MTFHFVNVDAEMAKLKDFQRRTVRHVVDRLYAKENPSRRFLVADEVGLGKTLVARGVIAHALEALAETVPRIDVVYVCSNAAIAHQNLTRLNLLKKQATNVATRLTLLPLEVHKLEGNRVNFVSFTPGTALDMRSKGGIKLERAVLFRILVRAYESSETALLNLLQGAVRKRDEWRDFARDDSTPINERLADDFLDALEKSSVRARLDEALVRFVRAKESYSSEDTQLRDEVIGQLRLLLAHTCVKALEPDLIILDEFQRFKDILDGESEASELARALFAYPDARVLLLSATPYRMLTLGHETDDDHHSDFLRTVDFLLDDASSREQLAEDLRVFRRGLLGTLPEGTAGAIDARQRIEACLRRVMCRTERVKSTSKRDAMVAERTLDTTLAPEDVRQALVAERTARLIGAADTIEYWKSSPYLLNVMRERGYDLSRRLEEHANDASPELIAHLERHEPDLLWKKSFQKFEPVPHANARLRALAADTVDAGAWKLLWLPPSLPYMKPSGPYADLGPGALTKALVFSSWTMVPDAIATLLSYETERRMVGDHRTDLQYFNLSRQRKPLLTFRVDRSRGPTGMSALALLYPCATFAEHIDPLSIALDLGGGEPASLDAVRARVGARLAPLVKRLVTDRGESAAPVDLRWYWAAPVLLDAKDSRVLEWIEAADGFRTLLDRDVDADDGEEDAEDSGFARHVDELARIVRGAERLGAPPDDLLDVLADLALASPAVCASRAVRRVARLDLASDAHVLSAAACVAKGFRTLFNLPETITLLQDPTDDLAYWRRVLAYCVDGNLQAVLDEYAHVVREATGHIKEDGTGVANAIAEAMLDALSPRTASLSLIERSARPKLGKVDSESFLVRSRSALRFGEIRDEEGSSVARADTVRTAFNSPFRPFILASTSVGQEGLDFHHYCHALYHWNLPTNPVDLEQREGRVHRYKGHAVRRNVARQYGLLALTDHYGGDSDPWERLFDLALRDRAADQNDLVPYWLYECEGGVSVERRIPMLPLSKEVVKFERLKKSLALYRLAFGQPRQEELLAFLADRNLSDAEIDELRIDLQPK